MFSYINHVEQRHERAVNNVSVSVTISKQVQKRGEWGTSSDIVLKFPETRDGTTGQTNVVTLIVVRIRKNVFKCCFPYTIILPIPDQVRENCCACAYE